MLETAARDRRGLDPADSAAYAAGATKRWTGFRWAGRAEGPINEEPSQQDDPPMRDEIGPGVRSERMEHKMMVETVDPQQNDSVLKEWRGADARVWRFHASLNRLALRLDRPGAPQHIYLVMVGCKHFVGSFGWKSADVSITFDESLDVHEGPYLVVDKGAGFQVRCSSVWIAQSLPKDLHMDFDEFLADEPSE